MEANEGRDMNLRNHKYTLLGVMITGGISLTVAGSRSLQGIVTVYSGPGIPIGLVAVILGCVSMGVSAGYLMRDIQSDEWDWVIEE